MQRTVNLVATPEFIRQFHPEARDPRPNAKPGIMSAPFPIVPETCRTALGRWLAENIITTRFDDDASSCAVLLPATEMGLHVRECGERLMRAQALPNAAEAEELFQRLEAWIAQQRKVIAGCGRLAFQYRVIQFQWPVCGSAAADGAKTPEDYFDVCARLIRTTGGVIVRAGLEGAALPEGLARTMASKAGGGDALLRRYQAANGAAAVEAVS